MRGGRGYITASLFTFATPDIIDEDAAHGLGRNGIEMRVVPPVHSLSDELEVGYVNEGGSVNGVSTPLMPKLSVRDAPQFFIDYRGQSFQHLMLPVGSMAQELSGGRYRRHQAANTSEKQRDYLATTKITSE